MACIRSNRFCACVQDKVCQFVNAKVLHNNPQQQILIKKDFTTTSFNHVKSQPVSGPAKGSLVSNISKKCQVNIPKLSSSFICYYLLFSVSTIDYIIFKVNLVEMPFPNKNTLGRS